MVLHLNSYLNCSKIYQVIKILIFSSLELKLVPAMSKPATVFLELSARLELNLANVTNDFAEFGRFHQMLSSQFVLIPK
jgi:hypothetical protein